RDEVPCSATLIGPRVFITAAHCQVAFGLGTEGAFEMGSATASPHRRFKVRHDNTIRSPYYDYPGSGANDLAIGILDDAVADIAPISLELSELPPGDAVTVVGWGSRKEDYRLRAGTNVVGGYDEGFPVIGPQEAGA